MRTRKLPVRAAAVGLGVLCTSLVIGPRLAQASSSPSAAPSTQGFVSASGTELVVDKQPWKFAGYNLPCANPEQLVQSGSLGVYLDDIKQNSGANVVRVWFFQSEGGPGNWSNFDAVISALKARGMRAIVALANSTSTCDEPNGPTLYKTISWYQTGYQGPYGGYALSFHDYAVDVAAHYANEPTVAFWQLLNEAQAPSYDSAGNLTCPDELAARDALRSFSDAMTSAIHAADPQHLVDLGTLSTGNCGIETDADYSYVHAGSLGLCEYHDYGNPAVQTPTSLSGIINDCQALGKPVYVGESGIPANVGSNGQPSSTCEPWPSCSPVPITFQSLAQRATFFRAKIQAADQNGLAGYVIWVKSPYYTDGTDGYAIADGDPTEQVLSGALQPYPTAPASLPESPLAVFLPLSMAGILGLLGVRVARRKHHKGGADS